MLELDRPTLYIAKSNETNVLYSYCFVSEHLYSASHNKEPYRSAQE